MARKSTEFYWGDRVEERNLRNLQLNQKKTTRLLANMYKVECAKLEENLLIILGKMEADIAERGAVFINDLYRTQTFYEIHQELSNRLKAIGEKEILITEQAIIDAYDEAIRTVDTYAARAGVIGQTYSIPEKIDALNVIHHSWCLDGQEFSERIWANKGQLLASLERQLQDYATQGASPWKLAQVLKEETAQKGTYNAYRLMRTETAHFQMKSTTERYKQMGFTHCTYAAHCDSTACDDCASHDGEIYTLDEIQAMIPKHPNCTCSFRLLKMEG